MQSNNHFNNNNNNNNQSIENNEIQHQKKKEIEAIKESYLVISNKKVIHTIIKSKNTYNKIT